MKTLSLRTTAPLVGLALALGCGGPRASSSTSTPLAPEQMTTMTTSQQNAALVTEALDAVFGRRDVGAIDRYFAEPYLQHNPHVPNGLDGLRGLVRSVGADFRHERFRVIADGDLVAVHGRYTGFGPTPVIAVDLFRIENGRIVEHWDGIQPEAPPNPSGHTMIDGPTEIGARDRTDDNRRLVREFVESVLQRGEAARIAEFLSTESYTQHNPQIADNLDGLGAALQALAAQGIHLRYQRVHRVVADGDFVLTQSEGEFGGPKAFYDIFRVENGRIVEHWDVIQDVPATTASGLPMF